MTERDPAQFVRMKVNGLMIDPSTNHPIVILRDEGAKLFLPIWIGVFEASAIQLELEGIERSRPMTHDLMRSLLEHLGSEVAKVVICDLKEHTFFAEIHLRRSGEEIVVDSRPSDALALALRVDAPIFVAPTVLERAKALEVPEDADDDERLRKYLEELGPEDLGKYTM